MNKQRVNQSLGQGLTSISSSFFEKIIFGVISYYIFSPIIMVGLLNLGSTFFNPQIALFQTGFLLIAIVALLEYKRHYEAVEKLAVKETMRQNLPLILLGGAFIWCALASLFSSNHELSLWGDAYRKEGLLTITAYIGMLLGGLSIRNRSLKKRIIQVFVVVQTILAVMMLLQWKGLAIKSVFNELSVNQVKDFVLWGSIFHNINHNGYYLTLGVMAVAGLFIFETNKRKQFFYGVSFILLSGVLVINNTFGSFLGVCISLICVVGICYYRQEKCKKIILIVLIFLGVTMIINGLTGIVHTNFSVLKDDLIQISLAISGSDINDNQEVNDLVNHSGSGRWGIWKGALEIIKDKPWFGTGPDNMRQAYQEKGLIMDRPHNEFLQIGASIGIPGLILYIFALFIGLFRLFKGIKKSDTIHLISLFMVIAYLESALFGNTMYYTYPYFLIFLGIAFSRSERENDNEKHKKGKIIEKKQ